MVTKKRRKAGGRRAGKAASKSMPGWIYMFMGLSIGLAVAFGVYVSDRKKLEQHAAPVAATAAAPQKAADPTPKVVEAEVKPGVTFDFYDMLPNLDVEVFTDERAPARPVTTPTKVSRPGIYIIQAGSFSQLADANRRKAEIALLGVRSDIKKGVANGRTVYRVYTDPLEQPADVNRVSKLLTASGIEILQKRVSD